MKYLMTKSAYEVLQSGRSKEEPATYPDGSKHFLKNSHKPMTHEMILEYISKSLCVPITEIVFAKEGDSD